jgi:inosine-uridine nucleoside N-ribohydrolase
MGGAFYSQGDEWNIACDPIAAKVISESGMPIVYVPHDVTKNISIGQTNYEYIIQHEFNGVSGYVADGLREWKKNDGWCPLLHDPVALYYCIKPELFKEKNIHTKFIGEGALAGMTLNFEVFSKMNGNAIKDSYPLVTVVTEVKTEEIVKDFMETLFGLCKK